MNRIKASIRELYNKGALHITIGTFVTKFVAFFGSIFVVRLLSKEEYGLLSYVENIYSYALIFAGFGLSNALLRYLVLAENDGKKKSYFEYIIKNSVIRNIIIVAIMVAVSRIAVFPDNYSEAVFWLPLLAALLPFQDLFNDDMFTLRAFFENKLYAYISLSVSIALILGRIAGAVLGGVGGVLWSRVIINFVSSVVCYHYIKTRFFQKEHAASLAVNDRREVNAYSFQYMITNGFWAIFMLNDTFFLGMLLNDPAALADYKVAYVLPGNISIFATAIGIFVAPYFTKNENNNSWIRDNFKRVFTVNVLIVGGVTAIIAVFGKLLITFMYGEQYLNILPLMNILLLAAFINSGLRYTAANLLAAMGEVKYNMYVSAGGIVLQIAADIIFIPKYGSMGVAVSSCVIFLIMAIVLLLLFYKKHLKAGTR